MRSLHIPDSTCVYKYSSNCPLFCVSPNPHRHSDPLRRNLYRFLTFIFSSNSEIDLLKKKMADLEARLDKKDADVNTKLDKLLKLMETPTIAPAQGVPSLPEASGSQSQSKTSLQTTTSPVRRDEPTKASTPVKNPNPTGVLDSLAKNTSDETDTTQNDLVIIDSTDEKASEDKLKSPPIILPKKNRGNRMANKRKFGDDAETTKPAKKAKVTPRDRVHQEARNEFTTAMTRIPAWMPEDWSPAALITNRFFWVHEEARCNLLAAGKNKGEKYAGYRLEFHKEAVRCAKIYDEEREKLFREQSGHKHFSLAYIMPWYFAHDKKWKRPQIHPDTSRISIKQFVFRTNINFLNTFLDELVGKFSSLQPLIPK